METISGGPSEQFLPDTILQAAKLNKALENWVVTEVPGEDEGKIGDVVFVTGPGDGGSSSSVGGGKVLQVVRATDDQNRVTNNVDWEDAGISVTITPSKADSNVLLFTSHNANITTTGNEAYARMQIVDSNDNPISGASDGLLGLLRSGGTLSQVRNSHFATMIAYDTPGSTSAKTYKVQFRVDAGMGAKVELPNDKRMIGQMYAIEVGA